MDEMRCEYCDKDLTGGGIIKYVQHYDECPNKPEPSKMSSKITEEDINNVIEELKVKELQTFPIMYTEYGVIDTPEKFEELIKIDPFWRDLFNNYMKKLK